MKREGGEIIVVLFPLQGRGLRFSFFFLFLLVLGHTVGGGAVGVQIGRDFRQAVDGVGVMAVSAAFIRRRLEKERSAKTRLLRQAVGPDLSNHSSKIHPNSNPTTPINPPPPSSTTARAAETAITPTPSTACRKSRPICVQIGRDFRQAVDGVGVMAVSAALAVVEEGGGGLIGVVRPDRLAEEAGFGAPLFLQSPSDEVNCRQIMHKIIDGDKDYEKRYLASFKAIAYSRRGRELAGDAPVPQAKKSAKR
ncbi:hypothetical protein PHJA_002101200 [Phtheirospermum japonicum]|uniref:Uncharacterized protein n=1 Tax=Phtheirospermum japonicum TaxID=374723 RepID=A0A830CZP4_9LAMI|nr:hypothetical protein PHJA_002101200 [Phtheirospermum japonicum]